MHLLRSPADAVVLSALLFPYLSSAVGNIDCAEIRIGETSWNLEKLGGPKSAIDAREIDEQLWRNVTYTIDICKPLKPADKESAEKRCPTGSRICAMERIASPDTPATDIKPHGYPIAGELKDYEGGNLDAEWTRLSPSDSQKEGLLLKMNGGHYTNLAGVSRDTKAVVTFLCDPDLKGDEHLIDPIDKYLDEKAKRADGIDSTKPKGGENKDDGQTASLTFKDFDTTGDADVLYLEWRTKYVCADVEGGKDTKKNNSWGFFTWFIIIVFLSTATYLIFGSWLNYNRYGARGWDLLPHGDTIRDVPYLLKDWTRSVLNTIQGGGSRGGYAAV